MFDVQFITSTRNKTVSGAVFKWASSWENVSSVVSDQVRLKLACSATEASMRLEILVTETRDITLSRQRTTKVLIRLRGCAGWSALLLFAYDIRHVFSWPGSNILLCVGICWYFPSMNLNFILFDIKPHIKCYWIDRREDFILRYLLVFYTADNVWANQTLFDIKLY